MSTAPTMKALPATCENPFPGLRPFREDEADIFFGQEDHVEDLLDRIGRKRFVAVLGQSGCGKSSVMRAGLLPELRKGKLADGSPRWVIVETQPGEDPLGRLAKALNDAFPDRGLNVAQEISRDSRALLRLVSQAGLPPRQKVLIFVDQFEELFRYRRQSSDAQQADQADHFVKLLLEAVHDPGSPIYIVIAMRSEFLGDCALFFDLAEQVNEGTFLLPRMTRDQAEQVISGPIGRRGARISRQLLQRLLNDAEGLDDGLPLLQHALRRVWEHWRASDPRPAEIGLADYELPPAKCKAWPSLLQAHLNVHLDSIYESLGRERESVARELFRVLSERDPKGRDVRRPVRYEELLLALPAELHANLQLVIDAFRDASQGRTFLMPPHGEALPKKMVDISHECLLRRWDRLRKWIGWEEEDRRHFELLADNADRAGWRGAAQSANVMPLDVYQLRLLQGWVRKAGRSDAWAKRYEGAHDPALGRPRRAFAPAVEYLDWSAAHWAKQEEEERLEAEEKVKQEAEYRRMQAENRATAAQLDLQRRRQQSIVAWAVGLVTLLVVSMWAVDSWRRGNIAQQERNDAVEARKVAENEKGKATRAKQEAVENALRFEEANKTLESQKLELVRQQEMLAIKTREAQRNAHAATVLAQDADRARRIAVQERSNTLDALKVAEDAKRSLESSNDALKTERDRLAQAYKDLEEGRQREEFRAAGSNARKDILAAANASVPEERVKQAHPALDKYLRAAQKRPKEEAVSDEVRSVFEHGLGAISAALQSGRLAGKPNIGPGARVAVAVSTPKGDQVVGLHATSHLRVQTQPVKGEVSGEEPNDLRDVKTGRGSPVRWALPLMELNHKLVSHDIAPDGSHIAIGTEGGRVTVLERVENPNQPHRAVMSKRPRWSPAELVRFGRDGRLLVTGAAKGGWTLFDLDRRKETAKNESSGHLLAQAAISENGRFLAYTTRRHGVVLESFAERAQRPGPPRVFVVEELDQSLPETDLPVDISNDGTVITVNRKSELEIHAMVDGVHRKLRGGTHVDAAALDSQGGREEWLAVAAHGGHITIYRWDSIQRALRSGASGLPAAHAEFQESGETRHSDVRRLTWGTGGTLAALDQYGFVNVWKPFAEPKQLDLITQLRLTLSSTLKKPSLELSDIARVMESIANVLKEMASGRPKEAPKAGF